MSGAGDGGSALLPGPLSPRRAVPVAVAIAGAGLLSFLACMYVVCTSLTTSPALLEAYSAVPRSAYLGPLVAFGTAFALNFLTLTFERDNNKFSLALLACYINLLAALSDFLSWRGHAPIVADAWGGGNQVVRQLMWLWTTPVMVYLLSRISDLQHHQILTTIGLDILMIVTGLISSLTSSKAIAWLFMILSSVCFVPIVRTLWGMFNASINEAKNDSHRMSLQVLRGCTVGLWFTFPTIFFLAKLGLLDVVTEEWLWTVGDFLGKVMFSSSLLQGNFLTIEQRRLIAMRIVEESNRIQVIQELRDLIEQKERFMSSMSHELRTPLNGIIGLSDALLIGSCGSVSEQVLRTITTIKTSGSRLLNLINDILDAASMRKGKLTIKHEKVNLHRIVDDVIELTQPLAKRGVKIVNHVPSSVPLVLGDTGRIIQIFNNLIGNSCKFTHNGFISIAATHKLDEVEVAVSDTGIGIPEEKFAHIFEAFEQVDMSTTRKYGGTGLGLNLVKQLVEAHGGTISVRSKMGVGTTFLFSLKVWDAAKEAARLAVEAEQHVAVAATTAVSEASVAAGPAAETAGKEGEKKVIRRRASRGPSFANLQTLMARESMQLGHAGHTHEDGTASEVAMPVHAAAGPVSSGIIRHASISSFRGYQAGQQGHMSGVHAAVQQALRSGTTAPPQKADIEMDQPATPKRGPASASTVHDHDAGAKAQGPGSVRQSQAGSQAAKAALQPLRKARPGPPRVLSVDDDPINQMVIQNLLVPEGYEIMQAMDGQEALKMVAEMETMPDIILLDVMMPGMSGYDVCRKLRELYPLSCVPIIMVSAKSKEEHIVEGLAAGSNDYVVKPFGRQEILARIAAHLRFRDNVYQAGEMAVEEDMHAHRGTMHEGWAQLAEVESKQYSLPPSIKSKVETTSGAATTLQVYEHLTLVMFGISNLDTLVSTITPEDICGALTGLHIYLEDALARHNLYMADSVEGRAVIVAGLSSQTPEEQVESVMALCKELLDVAGSIISSDSGKLELTFGIHSAAAQGMIIGVNHPVLYFSGALMDKAAQLQATCPTNCVHVSQRVVDHAKQQDLFVPGVGSDQNASYLAKVGSWQEKKQQLVENFDKYLGAHPFGPINSSALRLRPIQLALMTLVQCDPSALVELMTAPALRNSERSPPVGKGTQAGPGQKAEPGPGGTGAAGSGPGGGAAGAAAGGSKAEDGAGGGGSESGAGANNALVTKLQHDKEVLERQLEEVSNEAARLQDVVDSLEVEVRAKGELQGKLDKAAAEATSLRSRVSTLEQELAKSGSSQQAMQSQVKELEHKLIAAHHAAVKAEQQQQQQMMQQQRLQQAQPSGLSSRRSVAASPGELEGAMAGAGVLSPRATSTAAAVVVGRPQAVSRTASVAGSMDPREVSVFQRAMSPGLSMRTSSTALGSLVIPPLSHDMDIAQVLEALGMGSLISRFVEEEVTPALLPYLDDNAMKELGASSVGARLRLRAAAQTLS